MLGLKGLCVQCACVFVCVCVCVCVCAEYIFPLNGLFWLFIYAHIMKNICFKVLNSTNAKQDLLHYVPTWEEESKTQHHQHHTRFLGREQHLQNSSAEAHFR